MTELGYEVPVVGEKHQASDQRVSTALTEIKTVLNGRLTANNFAKETITIKKFKKPSAWVFNKEFFASIPVGATRGFFNNTNSWILVNAKITGASEIDFETPTTKLARTIGVGGTISFGPIRLLAGEELKIKAISGEVGRVDLSEYAET